MGGGWAEGFPGPAGGGCPLYPRASFSGPMYILRAISGCIPVCIMAFPLFGPKPSSVPAAPVGYLPIEARSATVRRFTDSETSLDGGHLTSAPRGGSHMETTYGKSNHDWHHLARGQKELAVQGMPQEGFRDQDAGSTMTRLNQPDLIGAYGTYTVPREAAVWRGIAGRGGVGD